MSVSGDSYEVQYCQSGPRTRVDVREAEDHREPGGACASSRSNRCERLLIVVICSVDYRRGRPRTRTIGNSVK